jgi:alpha-N-acetylglucosamine transferase
MATTNPKTISLCIFLFLSSALITLTLKSSHHNPNRSWLPTTPNSRISNQLDPNAPKIAFATFLAGSDNKLPDDDNDIKDEDDGYYLGTRVLAYQLLHSRTAGTNNSIAFIVLCTTDVSKRKRDRLRADGATVILVEKLNADWVHAAVERWKDVLAKLRLFQLTEYHKICFIDADTLVTKPLDGVFFDEATLTQATLPNANQIKDDEAHLPRTYMFATHGDYWGYGHEYPPSTDLSYLNCGFFVFTPSQVLFEYYMSLLKLPGRFDPGFPEQNLLNYAHRRDGNMPWKPLWYGWNVNWPTERDWRGGARSFHAKYWDGDPSHDPMLKGIWREQRAEMEGFYRGREIGGGG